MQCLDFSINFSSFVNTPAEFYQWRDRSSLMSGFLDNAARLVIYQMQTFKFKRDSKRIRKLDYICYECAARLELGNCKMHFTCPAVIMVLYLKKLSLLYHLK